MKHSVKNVPEDMELRLLLDNYASHNHPKVKAWLIAHPRYHLHFTPTYSSWLNQVERRFALITQPAIRGRSLNSVKELVKKIDQFVAAYNENRRPFLWQATAESIFEKISGLCVLTGFIQCLSFHY